MSKIHKVRFNQYSQRVLTIHETKRKFESYQNNNFVYGTFKRQFVSIPLYSRLVKVFPFDHAETYNYWITNFVFVNPRIGHFMIQLVRNKLPSLTLYLTCADKEKFKIVTSYFGPTGTIRNADVNDMIAMLEYFERMEK